jgi:CBS domain containing-hemolysin-like protein
MRKSYYAIPLKELKRRANRHDPTAAALYRVVAYGESLDLFLWFVIAAFSAGGFVLLSEIAPGWLSFIAIVGLLWACYGLIPSSRLTPFGSRLTIFFVPMTARLLGYLQPVLNRAGRLASNRYNAPAQTGLYERADLLELIAQQMRQPDSRFSSEELIIASQILNFNDYTVHDILVDWSTVHTLAPDDVVGPVVIDEAHRSGQPLMPVVDPTIRNQQIVGMLPVQKLGLGSAGKARDLMDTTVYYLHEDDSLTEALHACYVTGQSLFVVLGSDGKDIGIVTLASLLHKMLGDLPAMSTTIYTEHQEVMRRHAAQPNVDHQPESEQNPVATEQTVVE